MVREGGREGGKEGGRKGGREGERERGRERGKRDNKVVCISTKNVSEDINQFPPKTLEGTLAGYTC